MSLSIAALLALTGCLQPRATRSAVLSPAAREGDARPVEIRPPPDLADNYEHAIMRVIADVTCTGTLIDEDLVLTAHHCVARHDAAGHATRVDVEPKEVNVQLGTTALSWSEVGVRAIVTPDCGYASGDGDIAILVLSRKLVGVATIPVHEESEAGPSLRVHGANETIEARGYGQCAASAGAPVELRKRNGQAVEVVEEGSFWGYAAICRGDSGGPVFIATPGDCPGRDGANRPQTPGKLVGVVSASVMSTEVGAATGWSMFTRLDVWPQLFSAAHEIARGATAAEQPPFRSCKHEGPRPKATRVR